MTIKVMLKLCSLAALALLVFAALGPAKWVPRSGLGWQFDHVIGFFVFTLMFCLIWGRPVVVVGSLTSFAVLLEGLQVFTPDRSADLHAALYNAGAVLTAALVTELFIRAPRRLNGRTVLMPQRFRPVAISIRATAASRRVESLG
jgi:VanZ family protein